MSRPARIGAAAVGALVALGALWAVLQAVAGTTSEGRLALAGPVRAVHLEVDQGDLRIAAGGRDVTADARERSFLVGLSREAASDDGEARLRWSCRLWTSCRADVRAGTPADARVRARTGFGAVHVEGPAGDLDIATRGGEVEVAGLTAGRARVEARGDVRLAFVRAPVAVEVDASAGDVEIRVPAGAYRIEAATGGGTVSVRGLRHDPAAARSIVVDTSAGDVLMAAAG
jgi:hypothetical protein